MHEQSLIVAGAIYSFYKCPTHMLLTKKSSNSLTQTSYSLSTC